MLISESLWRLDVDSFASLRWLQLMSTSWEIICVFWDLRRCTQISNGIYIQTEISSPAWANDLLFRCPKKQKMFRKESQECSQSVWQSSETKYYHFTPLRLHIYGLGHRRRHDKREISIKIHKKSAFNWQKAGWSELTPEVPGKMIMQAM